MARFLSLALLASLALVCLGQLAGVAAGCVENMGADVPSIGNFHGKGRELSQCVREYRQKYGRKFKCGRGLRGKTCIQIKDYFKLFVDDLRLCLMGPTTAAPTTTTTPLPNPRDCNDLFDRGEAGNRVSTIFPDGVTPVSVKCIEDATVILNRDSFSTGFNRTYSEYAAGFGPRNGDYYLGNDIIHTLTSTGNYKLRADIVRPDDTQQFAEYTMFLVGPASGRYNATVGGYSGNAGDALTSINGLTFSTADNATEFSVFEVAAGFQGGWWYTDFPSDNLAAVTTNPSGTIPFFAWGETVNTAIQSVTLSLKRL